MGLGQRRDMESNLDMSRLAKYPVPRIPASVGQRVWRMFCESKTAWAGAIIVLIMIASALFAEHISPHNPLTQSIRQRLMGPVWMTDNSTYLLGTDSLGRDLLSRIIYGTRISLIIGLSAVVVSGVVGVALGLLAGYFQGRLETVIMRLADVQLAVPTLVLALAVIAVLGPSLRNLIIVLGVTGWVAYARIVRGEVLSVREREFVEAARATGASHARIILRHILPNVTASIIVVSTLRVATVILAEATLSFLGVGVQPPTPTWGGMVSEGRNYITSAWWVSAFPGIAIAVAVLGINLLGDWLRDVLDPRLRS